MAVFGSVVISTGGLLIRSLEATTEWQVVFWRGIFLTLGTVGILLFQYRSAVFRETRRIGRLGLLGGLFHGGALTGYVLSITNTTVANAVFTMSTVPFFTAILAWVLLGERIGARTVFAIAAALTGVALMLSDGISTGTVFGNVSALFAAVCIACLVIILRKGRGVDMLPLTALGALLSALVAAIMMGGDYNIPFHDLILCLILGGVISCLGHFLFVVASRNISGAELTLLTLIEIILGPLWVWLFINEVPSAMTLIGGAVLLSAVGSHALFSLAGQRE